MPFLSNIFDYLLFGTHEDRKLRCAFELAAQAIHSNDTPVLKAVLVKTTFNHPEKQSLLRNAISADNVESFEVLLEGTGTKVSEQMSFNRSFTFGSEVQDIPMLPFAISRGSEKISRFLASHPDTDLRASSCITSFSTSACPASGRLYTSLSTITLPDAQSAARDAGMTEVEKIINARLQGPAQHPSNI